MKGHYRITRDKWGECTIYKKGWFKWVQRGEARKTYVEALTVIANLEKYGTSENVVYDSEQGESPVEER